MCVFRFDLFRMMIWKYICSTLGIIDEIPILITPI